MSRSAALCVATTVVMCLSKTMAFHVTVLPQISTTGSEFVSASASASASAHSSRHLTQLQMGLFDGVKDAFSAPALERGTLNSERETPIDRWMGWSVSKDNQQQAPNAVPSDYVDSMDASNYVTVELTKPMGIVFEENDEEYGGIFIQSLKEDSAAAAILQPGDQLVGVDKSKVSSLVFDAALNAIVESTGPTTQLVLFRGTAKQFYGPTGASQAWLEEFLANNPSSNNNNNNNNNSNSSGETTETVAREEA